MLELCRHGCLSGRCGWEVARRSRRERRGSEHSWRRRLQWLSGSGGLGRDLVRSASTNLLPQGTRWTTEVTFVAPDSGRGATAEQKSKAAGGGARSTFTRSIWGCFALDREGAGEAGLEIQQAGPLGSDGDADHRRHHRAQILDPGFAAFGAEVAFAGGGVFGDDSFYWLKTRGASYQKHLVGIHVVVDGERDFWIFRERLELGRFGRRSKNELTAIPVKADGNDAGRAVGRNVGETRGDGGF